MRRIIALLIAIVTVCAAMADAEIKWINNVYDFGAFDEDTKDKRACFKFVNTGDEPVSIISATATCGCTTPRYDQSPVQPGDTAAVEVSYDPSGRPGRFNKQVYVRTSASPERYKLLIQGTVIGSPQTLQGRYPLSIGNLRLERGAVMMGRVKAGQSKLAYVDGYNGSSDSLRPAIVYAPEYIHTRIAPTVVPPGEMMSIDFEMSSDISGMWGVVNDTVMITDGIAEPYALPLVAVVEEDFSGLTPQQLHDAPVATLDGDRVILSKLTDGHIRTGSIKLRNDGKDPLMVRRVYSADPGIVVDITETVIKKGKSAEIKVLYDPSVLPTDIVNYRVTLITNDPQNPTQGIRVVGE